MNEAPRAAHLTPVTDNEARGQEIRRRRMRLGITSLDAFAAKVGMSRKGVTSAEKGTASKGTYDRIDAWLEAFEDEVGECGDGDEVKPSDQVEFHVSGIYGVRELVIKGPVSDMAEMEAVVERLLRGASEAD